MTFDEQTRLTVTLKCEGCDATFEGTAQEAHDQDWDGPPWFWSHVTCPDCPITKTLWYNLLSARESQ